MRALALLLLPTLGAAAPGQAVDLGLLVDRPAALETGLGTGLTAGYTGPGALTWGARLGWSRATEFTRLREVTHDDLRARAEGVARYVAGGGTAELRLGLGVTTVCESRVRNQADRAGLSDAEATEAAWQLLPAADLSLAAAMRVWHDFGLRASLGPEAHLADGALRWGFVGGLAVAWLP